MSPLDINTAVLPAIPVDSTPLTVSATPNYVLVGPADGTDPNRVTVQLGAAAAAGANALTVDALTVALPAGTVLDFSGVSVTLSAAAAVGATNLAVNALSSAIPDNATAEYGLFRRVPLNEEFTLDLKDDNESIKVHGRLTPMTSKNGIDIEASIKTVAGIQDPTVKDLIEAGMKLGAGAKRSFIFVYNDGFAVLARMLVGTMKPDGKTGGAMRYESKLMLAGDLYWTNLNDAGAVWKKVE